MDGEFTGEVCLIICDDLVGSEKLKCDFIVKNNIIVKHFPNIVFPDWFLDINRKLPRFDKMIPQYHKMHIFNIFFKRWDYIWYIDCGMSIYSDVSPILNMAEKGVLFAHSDAFPTYELKLNCQFEKLEPYYSDLKNSHDLNIDYFQSGTLLFDTDIIDSDTFNELYNLMLTYPISRTNEQGIMNIYFTKICKYWKQLPIGGRDGIHHYYDFWSRNPSHNHIMTKYIREF